MAPSHTICEYHEDYLLQLASDIHSLGQWVQSSLLAFRALRRATLQPPALPPPGPTSGTGASPPSSTGMSPPAPAPAPSLPTPPPAYPTPSPPPEEPRISMEVTETATKPHAPRSRQKPRSRVQTRTPLPPAMAPCVTLRYIGTLRNRNLPHPRYIIDTLKVISEISIAAIRYTRDHQIVLYPKAPCTVQDLIDKSGSLHSLLNTILGPADKPPPAFDTGSSWTRVVIHRAPLPVWEPPSSRYNETRPLPRPVNCRLGDLVDDLCASNSIDRNSVHDARPLCSLESRDTLFLTSEKRAPQHCSVMICLSNGDTATRLLKHGAFVQGAHCRVTPYRPRRST
ncbi:hypothetical protein AURDEDRAFT_172258 [Auricularia subglabra TFB-10046 SS5]|nr:hypothetical protein AURDEDRAFT_172258 [Auricularia subglabra TFB-10046 SS5]